MDAADFEPEVVPAPRSHDAEGFVRELGVDRQHALRGPDVGQQAERLWRQQFVDDLADRFRRQRLVGEADLPAFRDDIRLVANVQDQCFAIHKNDGLQERRDESH